MRGLRVIESWLRVLLSLLWTVVLGVPFVAMIYGRYLFGLTARFFGRSDLLERAIDRNLETYEIVSRDLWSRGIFVITRMSICAREASTIDWTKTHVICANHSSVFDIFALLSAVPVPLRFVAKRELARWPIIGWALRPTGQVLVDRGNRERAIRSISDFNPNHRGQIVFFVEGTRSLDGELLPFKKGAFHFALSNNLPLLPTAIGGAHRALAREAWWNLNPGSEVLVDFCQPIGVPSAWGQEERGDLVESLSERTRAGITEALDRGDRDRSAA